MHASQALALEAILEKGLANAKKPGGLLAGLGARISIASELRPRGQLQERLATGVEPLDRLLPGGLPKGKLIELAGRRSSGRFSIGLSALASVTSSGEPAALVDLGEHLDPRGAADSGVDLELLLWVRPRRVKEALASAEMLLERRLPLRRRGLRPFRRRRPLRARRRLDPPRARGRSAGLFSSSPDSLPLERHRRRCRPRDRRLPPPLAGHRQNPSPLDRPLLPLDPPETRP